MNKYQYRISDKPVQEIWFYEACKKGKNLQILTGKWKLIDRCSDSSNLCSLCAENKADTNPNLAAAKKET